jgi:NADH-quinone oxidoreductase subunit H
MLFISDPVMFIANWLQNFLLGWGLPKELVVAILSFIGSSMIAVVMLCLVVALIIMERKLGGRFQGRFGPNRVGPYGLLQTIPDMIKIFTKEYITPQGADIIIYNLAPILITSAVLLIWAVVPYTSSVVGADVNVGALYLIAVGSFGTLAILMAGWSSNNKYALMGAFRTVAQMISYEVPMVLVLLIPVIFTGSMGINDIVKAQTVWFILLSPLSALIFFIAAQAEVARAPFDLLEAESEIVAGFHIEYSGLKFGFFYVAEFLHSFTMSALVATLFLGGWQGPWVEAFPVLGFFYFSIKAFIVYFLVLWVRFSLPRVRIDQMMDFCWKALIPVSLTLVMVTAIVQKLLVGAGAALPIQVAVHLMVNIAITWITVQIMLAKQARKPRRKPVADIRPVAVGSPSTPSTKSV